MITIPFILLLLITLCYSDTIILQGDLSRALEPITLGGLMTPILIIYFIFILSKYKHYPIIKWLYEIIIIFFIVLFGTLLIGFFGDGVKKWFNNLSK
jgi:fructose-specific phosphotransferase system IIC component